VLSMCSVGICQASPSNSARHGNAVTIQWEFIPLVLKSSGVDFYDDKENSRIVTLYFKETSPNSKSVPK
jgi:hypothetical protein